MSELIPLPRRPIRSYALRAGRITRAQRRALQTHWAEFGVDDSDDLLNLDTLFGRKAATVLEIGFGDGEVLAAMAEAQPDTNFIGIEVYPSGIGALLNQIKSQALDNIRILRGDAAKIVAQRFAARCLSKVFILFPDPWPKKRHYKRRLIQSDFVATLSTKVCLGGVLILATDWADYATAMHAAVVESRCYQRLDAPQPRAVSKFERRGKALGYRIYELQYKVVASSHN